MHQLVRFGYGEKSGCVETGSPGTRLTPADPRQAACWVWKGPRAQHQLVRLANWSDLGMAKTPAHQLARFGYGEKSGRVESGLTRRAAYRRHAGRGRAPGPTANWPDLAMAKTAL